MRVIHYTLQLCYWQRLYLRLLSFSQSELTIIVAFKKKIIRKGSDSYTRKPKVHFSYPILYFEFYHCKCLCFNTVLCETKSLVNSLAIIIIIFFWSRPVFRYFKVSKLTEMENPSWPNAEDNHFVSPLASVQLPWLYIWGQRRHTCGDLSFCFM